MVDIHIRDISDPEKRRQLVDEILAKTGKTDLVIEVAVRPDFRGNRARLLLLGSVAGPVNYVAHEDRPSTYGSFTTRQDQELLLRVKSYIEADQDYAYRNRYDRDEDGWKYVHHECDPGRYWNVVVRVKDLINITQQASMEPVLTKKEIES